MFAASKLAKSKPFTAPSHKDSLNSNSRKKFTNDLNGRTQDLCNRSFDTAQNMFNKSGGNLRQTKLCLRNRHENEQDNLPSTSKKNTTATVEFYLMPAPNEKSISLKRPLQEPPSGSNRKNYESEKTSRGEDIIKPSNPMEKNGRNKLVIMGKVDFCLKMRKLYPKLNILWDVYGKVVKIIPGKNRGENILILRATTDRGPVIQSIYYDFGNVLDNFPPGTCLRAIGEFMNENRLRTFRLEPFDCGKYESEFSRIQNVTSFSLLQTNMKAS